MTDMCRKNIRIWLRDAHAMEVQAENLLSGKINRLKDYLSSCHKIDFEINRIKQHQIVLSIRIQQLGSAPSMIKDATAKVVAETQNITALLVNDDPVNDILTLHTFTQTAIGSYKILIAAAESVNDSETKQVCLDILGDTESRAVWIKEGLAEVTKKFLLTLA